MSSGQTPNSQNINRVGRGVADATPVVTHPEYQYFRQDWFKLRDVIAGQKEVKRKGEIYLPKMKGMDQEDYAGYIERATFYNMTRQTQTGMVGQVFRKEPVIRNLPPKFKSKIRNLFAKDGVGHVNFTKTVVGEQIGIGRFGVLVDAPTTPSQNPTAYATGYSAENILDWDKGEVNGFFVLTRVLLREFVRTTNIVANDPANNAALLQARGMLAPKDTRAARAKALAASTMVQQSGRFTDSYTYRTVFRELLLTEQENGTWVYTQQVYEDGFGGDFTEFTPKIRGQVLSFIPFEFFGSMSNSESVEASPMLDIADLNLSHYRTYAELEYGRLYTALPVYYAPGSDGSSPAEYHVGPNTVWEVPVGATPGILEFHGTGLKTLEGALVSKEGQISAIGGRLMPGQKGISESSNQTVLREANEQAVLLNCIGAAQTGMTIVVRWWLMFQDVPLGQTEDLSYEINQSFLSTPIGAREIRAIQLMYSDGLITVEQLYGYLLKAEIVEPNTDLEEFKADLANPDSFLNSPDAQARQRGFASRQQELDDARISREADLAQQELDQNTQDAPIDPLKTDPLIVAKHKLMARAQAHTENMDKGHLALKKKEVAIKQQIADKPTPKPPARPKGK